MHPGGYKAREGKLMKIAAEVHLSTSSPQQRAPELVGGEERKSMFSGIFSMLGLGGHVSQGGEIQGQLPEMKSPDGRGRENQN